MKDPVRFELAPVGGVPELRTGMVHVWRIDLTHTQGELEWLDAAERERAAGFRLDKHRRRFIASHTAMRQLLAAYADDGPEALRFEFGQRGKPRLSAPAELEFNLAHSGERALLAVGRSGSLGVDLEQLRDFRDARGLARRTFSAAEYASLTEGDGDAWRCGFFCCWTRKEAFVKALGRGLSQPLAEFDVSVVPEDPRILAVRAAGIDARDWRLWELDMPTGWAGSLCTTSAVVTVRGLVNGVR